MRIFTIYYCWRLNTKIENGRLNIIQEGNHRKFVKKVNQVTFNAKDGIKRGQTIIFNTDRGVFKIINGKITLIEIARGVRLKEDIINQISFKINISKNLKKISQNIYFDKKIGLKKNLN